MDEKSRKIWQVKSYIRRYGIMDDYITSYMNNYNIHLKDLGERIEDLLTQTEVTTNQDNEQEQNQIPFFTTNKGATPPF